MTHTRISELTLVARLTDQIRGNVDSSDLKRALYSTDASNYRVLPTVVVTPLDTDDLIQILEIARDTGTPVTMRGGGTSVAGNSIGTGIVVDTSVHLNKIIEIDPISRTARVQPGVVLAQLQDAVAQFGLRFGPDPSTSSRATFGGSIANNACGPHALAYGKSGAQVVSMDVVDGRGRRFKTSAGFDEVPGLQKLVNANLAILRTEFGKFGRQASGYSLEHLLPENGKNLAFALAGTEGTLVIILEATVKLVPITPAPALVILGYQSMPDAGDDAANLLLLKPLAIEGLDIRLIDIAREHWNTGNFPEFPDGNGWLMVEVGGKDAAEAVANGEKLAAASTAITSRVVPAGSEAKTLWQLRADGSGYAGRTLRNEQAWPGWEDAAVPPENLGKYLRQLEPIMQKHGVQGVPFGHFGDGCIHIRIDFPLDKEKETFRAFIEDATDLVLGLGGSPSGEHGDGRARSEMLTRMYSPEAIAFFGALKEIFDPLNILNPGVIVNPKKIDADLRRITAHPIHSSSGFAFASDQGDFTKAIHRCVGIGKCRADNSHSGGFMCPSYLATKDEKDVTRGRARVLQEMTQGKIGKEAWGSKMVEEALDLCLSCKACANDCPAEVDMARYKSEVLFRKYKGRLRPRNHYLLGQLPRWAKLARISPTFINFMTSSPLRTVILALGGMDSRRKIPAFAKKRFLASKPLNSTKIEKSGKPQIVLWVDSFSDSFSPTVPMAAKKLLENIGYEVVIPLSSPCCGLTWISTGQLDGAKKKLRNLLDIFAPYVERGLEIVGLEPSCTAVLRSDLLDLHPEDPRSALVGRATKTLAEVIQGASANPALSWRPPDLSDMTIVVQPHCHQHSVMGFREDREVLQSTKITFTQLAGCCGLAGNFGMEKGHYETSVAVAESALLPALREKNTNTVFIADGFSCRTQAEQLAGIKGLSLAELLVSKIT